MCSRSVESIADFGAEGAIHCPSGSSRKCWRRSGPGGGRRVGAELVRAVAGRATADQVQPRSPVAERAPHVKSFVVYGNRCPRRVASSRQCNRRSWITLPAWGWITVSGPSGKELTLIASVPAISSAPADVSRMESCDCCTSHSVTIFGRAVGDDGSGRSRCRRASLFQDHAVVAPVDTRLRP